MACRSLQGKCWREKHVKGVTRDHDKQQQRHDAVSPELAVLRGYPGG